MDKYNIINTNIEIINNIIYNLLNKYNEVNKKIEMLKNNNLKFNDTSKMLIFQNKIIKNELLYFNNHKYIIQNNIKPILLKISEDITFICLSVIGIYRDIAINDNKPLKISKKTDTINIIINDIEYNINLIETVIKKIKEYNTKLYNDLINSNFHCKTLHNNINIKCTHIELEYLKLKNEYINTIDYFIDYSNCIAKQIDNMLIYNFII
jgi:hypothetical protein